MSQPRQVLPNVTYLITRRTILRHMLLRPDSVMTQIIVYLLAVLAERAGLQVHAICAMSTHIHLVVTDVKGQLPDFLRPFHRMVALCTMAHRNWRGGIWDKSATSVVRLETRAAVVEKIAYVLANPVAAGLVRDAHEWPGAKSLVKDIGGSPLRAGRPAVYLNPKNWPGEAALSIVPPPGIEPAELESFRRQVSAELAALEERAEGAVREQGRRFLGAERACRVALTARATTVEPLLAINPTVAVGRNQGDAWRCAAAVAEAFRAAYRSALALWRKGVRDAVFPAGTWLMSKLHGVAVAGAARAV